MIVGWCAPLSLCLPTAGNNVTYYWRCTRNTMGTKCQELSFNRTLDPIQPSVDGDEPTTWVHLSSSQAALHQRLETQAVNHAAGGNETGKLLFTCVHRMCRLWFIMIIIMILIIIWLFSLWLSYHDCYCVAIMITILMLIPTLYNYTSLYISKKVSIQS